MRDDLEDCPDGACRFCGPDACDRGDDSADEAEPADGTMLDKILQHLQLNKKTHCLSDVVFDVLDAIDRCDGNYRMLTLAYNETTAIIACSEVFDRPSSIIKITFEDITDKVNLLSICGDGSGDDGAKNIQE